MVKYLTFSILILGLCFNVSAQKRKKKKKNQECPTYSEDVSATVVTYPSISIDSLTPETEVVDVDVVPLKNDNQSVDSLVAVQLKYQGKDIGPGYRIQIWTGQNHISMQNNISVFKTEFEELGLAVHDKYDNAYFRVKVGDFYQNEHLQAYRALVKIREKFPNALLVPADVYL